MINIRKNSLIKEDIHNILHNIIMVNNLHHQPIITKTILIILNNILNKDSLVIDNNKNINKKTK